MSQEDDRDEVLREFHGEMAEHFTDPGWKRYDALVEAWNACPEKFRKIFLEAVAVKDAEGK